MLRTASLLSPIHLMSEIWSHGMYSSSLSDYGKEVLNLDTTLWESMGIELCDPIITRRCLVYPGVGMVCRAIASRESGVVTDVTICDEYGATVTYFLARWSPGAQRILRDT